MPSCLLWKVLVNRLLSILKAAWQKRIQIFRRAAFFYDFLRELTYANFRGFFYLNELP